MKPTAGAEREPILDGLRGVAILGILLINIEVMRGPEWLVLIAGGTIPEPAEGINGVISFGLGWLAHGKFLSCLAILFGVGAGLMSARALDAGESPRSLLARRYAVLLVFGIAHMVLFPGDILFLYGLTGLTLVPFVRLRVPALLVSAAVLYLAFNAVSIVLFGALQPAAAPEGGAGINEQNYHLYKRAAEVLAIYTSGNFLQVLNANVAQSILLQPLQLYAIPWLLALFLLGFALARLGIVADLAAHRGKLLIAAFIGLAAGLPLNFALGYGGPLVGWGWAPADQPQWITTWSGIADVAGEPVLAIGYLSALAVVWMGFGTPRALAAVGRMALTAYILESALALVVFGVFRLYGKLSIAESLGVVVGIWVVVLIVCPLWLRRFQFGPLEWLWRRLTYAGALPR